MLQKDQRRLWELQDKGIWMNNFQTHVSWFESLQSSLVKLLQKQGIIIQLNNIFSTNWLHTRNWVVRAAAKPDDVCDEKKKTLHFSPGFQLHMIKTA